LAYMYEARTDNCHVVRPIYRCHVASIKKIDYPALLVRVFVDPVKHAQSRIRAGSVVIAWPTSKSSSWPRCVCCAVVPHYSSAVSVESVQESWYSMRSRRFVAASVALGPLEPLSLASAGLKVWCDGSGVLATGDHGAAHFVAVGVNCRNVSMLSLTYVRELQCRLTRPLQEQRPSIKLTCLAPTHAITQLVQRGLLASSALGHPGHR
jgi:hypothetical protein